jgi:hypothetical protein
MQFNKEPTMDDAIDILVKTDPIIRHVWEHYKMNKQTTPISPSDIEYFWKKTTDCFGNISNMKKVTCND